MQRFGGQALFVAAGGYHHHIGLSQETRQLGGWRGKDPNPGPPSSSSASSSSPRRAELELGALRFKAGFFGPMVGKPTASLNISQETRQLGGWRGKDPNPGPPSSSSASSTDAAEKANLLERLDAAGISSQDAGERIQLRDPSGNGIVLVV